MCRRRKWRFLPATRTSRTPQNNRRPMRSAAICLLIIVLLGADRAAHAAVPVYGYEIVHTYPHDPTAFTEGLFYLNGFLYESTGLEHHSSIRKVRLETG